MKYIFRRVLYLLPILLTINFMTFLLFFSVNTPDDIARFHLGEKYISTAQIEDWKTQHGYQYPLFYNAKEKSYLKITNTLFYQKSIKLFLFDFGVSDSGRVIKTDILQRMWPSFALALPMLFIGLLTNITFALLLIYCRYSYLETLGLIVCIVLMSISPLFYIMSAQYFIAKLSQWLPVSGYEGGFEAWRYLLLPIIIGIVSGLGTGARWYRTIFLEEQSKDYVKTAKSKGLSDLRILFFHILRNGLLPILTGIVVIIPSLFLGSLLLESFFGIPGLGSYTIDAIHQQDFAIVRVMVFLGALLYIIGLVLTDLSYAIADPRVRL
jgi:peptide/nickel transport system permease protein